MDYVKKFDSSIEKALTRYIRKPEIVYGMIILFIALYAAHIAPAVPEVISKIFSNTYFKLMFMIFILWMAQISPSMSIVIAVGFLMITNYANNKALFEMLDNTSTPETAETPETAGPEQPVKLSIFDKLKKFPGVSKVIDTFQEKIGGKEKELAEYRKRAAQKVIEDDKKEFERN